MSAEQRLEYVLSRFESVTAGSGYWRAKCPGHPDETASLSISEGQDGRILLNCHAGCTVERIVAAAGLEMTDLFDNARREPLPQRAGTETPYRYTDEQGVLLYEVVRRDLSNGEKQIRQRRPDGRGGWNWKLGNVRRVLYRLPRVMQAVANGETVYLAEGEKCVVALERLGLTATCNPGGVGKWRNEFSAVLRGADVVIFPDNDKPGMEHAEQVAASLRGVAASVKIVELPGLGEKDDVYDWLKRGGTKDDLLRLVAAAPVLENSASTGRAVGAEVDETGGEAKASLSRFFTAAELLDLDVPEPKWLVEGVLPEGVSILAAPPKAGKTMLALNLAIALATGGMALGKQPVEQIGVLYLALEGSTGGLKRRLEAMCPEGKRPDKLYIAQDFPAIDEGGNEEIRAFLALHPEVKLIMIDTFALARSRRFNGRGTSYDISVEHMGPFNALARELGINLLLITHVRKAESDDPLATVSGSYGFTGSADNVLVLERMRGSADAKLTVVAREQEEQELVMRFDATLATWVLEGDIRERASTPERQEVLDALKAAGEPMRTSDVARTLGKKDPNVSYLLQQLEREGLVQKAGWGRYTLPVATKSTKSTKSDSGDAAHNFKDFKDFKDCEGDGYSEEVEFEDDDMVAY